MNATLIGIDISAADYKKKDRPDARLRIVEALPHVAALPAAGLLRASDDAVDALVCVLAGRDFMVGHALPPEHDALARAEGWIWVRRAAEPAGAE